MCAQAQGRLSSAHPPCPKQLLSVKIVYNPKKPLSSTPTPSIKFVYKSKERYHPAPTPPQTLNCLASNVCTSPRNVITPPTPTKTVQPAVHPKQPTQWWSMMQIRFLGRVATAGPSACAWACGPCDAPPSRQALQIALVGKSGCHAFFLIVFLQVAYFLWPGNDTKKML